MQTKTNKKIEKLFYKASTQSRLGNHEKAIFYYDKIIGTYSSNKKIVARAYAYKGDEHDDMADYEEAVKCYSKAIDNDANFSHIYINKLWVMSVGLMRYNEVLELYNQDKNKYYCPSTVVAFICQHGMSKIEKSLLNGLKNYGNYYYYLFSNFYHINGKYNEKDICINMAEKELTSQSWKLRLWTYLMVGHIYQIHEEHSEAFKYYKKALNLKNNYKPVMLKLEKLMKSIVEEIEKYKEGDIVRMFKRSIQFGIDPWKIKVGVLLDYVSQNKNRKKYIELIEFVLDKGFVRNMKDILINLKTFTEEQVINFVNSAISAGVKFEKYDYSNLLLEIAKLDKPLPDLMEICILSGADVNYTDQRGKSALHYAAGKSDLLNFYKLISYGADLTLKDAYGSTAFKIFKNSKHSFNFSVFLKKLLVRMFEPISNNFENNFNKIENSEKPDYIFSIVQGELRKVNAYIEKGNHQELQKYITNSHREYKLPIGYELTQTNMVLSPLVAKAFEEAKKGKVNFIITCALLSLYGVEFPQFQEEIYPENHVKTTEEINKENTIKNIRMACDLILVKQNGVFLKTIPTQLKENTFLNSTVVNSERVFENFTKQYESFVKIAAFYPLLGIVSWAMTTGKHDLGKELGRGYNRRLKIILDGNSKYVDGVACGFKSNRLGAYFHNSNNVYIGIKETKFNPPQEIYSTIIHELTHVISHEVYRNSSRPYAARDSVKINKFNEAIEYIKKNISGGHLKPFNGLFGDDNYKKEDYHSEFIARLVELVYQKFLNQNAVTDIDSICKYLNSFSSVMSNCFKDFYDDCSAHLQKIRQNSLIDFEAKLQRFVGLAASSKQAAKSLKEALDIKVGMLRDVNIFYENETNRSNEDYFKKSDAHSSKGKLTSKDFNELIEAFDQIKANIDDQLDFFKAYFIENIVKKGLDLNLGLKGTSDSKYVLKDEKQAKIIFLLFKEDVSVEQFQRVYLNEVVVFSSSTNAGDREYFISKWDLDDFSCMAYEQIYSSAVEDEPKNTIRCFFPDDFRYAIVQINNKLCSYSFKKERAIEKYAAKPLEELSKQTFLFAKKLNNKMIVVKNKEHAFKFYDYTGWNIGSEIEPGFEWIHNLSDDSFMLGKSKTFPVKHVKINPDNNSFVTKQITGKGHDGEIYSILKMSKEKIAIGMKNKILLYQLSEKSSDINLSKVYALRDDSLSKSFKIDSIHEHNEKLLLVSSAGEGNNSYMLYLDSGCFVKCKKPALDSNGSKLNHYEYELENFEKANRFYLEGKKIIYQQGDETENSRAVRYLTDAKHIYSTLLNRQGFFTPFEYNKMKHKFKKIDDLSKPMCNVSALGTTFFNYF